LHFVTLPFAMNYLVNGLLWLIQWSFDVREPQCSGSQIFVITISIQLTVTFVTRTDKLELNHVAGDSAPPNLLLLCTSLSAQSSSVFINPGSLLKGRPCLNHLMYLKLQIIVLFHYQWIVLLLYAFWSYMFCYCYFISYGNQKCFQHLQCIQEFVIVFWSHSRTSRIYCVSCPLKNGLCVCRGLTVSLNNHLTIVCVCWGLTVSLNNCVCAGDWLCHLTIVCVQGTDCVT
jgi:hypothetical protein